MRFGVVMIVAISLAGCVTSRPIGGQWGTASPVHEVFSDGSFGVIACRNGGAMAEAGALKAWKALHAPTGVGEVVLPTPRVAEQRESGVYSRRGPSVLAIVSLYKCDKCPHWHNGGTAAGFVVAPGVLATNWHVVEGNDEQFAAAVTSGGEVLAITALLAYDEADDTAMLRFDPASREIEAIPLRVGAPVGTSVVAIAHPDKKYWTMTEGMISRRAWVYGGVNGDVKRLRPKSLNDASPVGQTYEPVYAEMLRPVVTVTADFGVGSSGGPVMDLAGNAIGMIASTHTVYSSGAPASDGHEHEREPQMTIRTCVPAESLLRLLGRR